MKQLIVIIPLLFLTFSCTTQRKLQRSESEFLTSQINQKVFMTNPDCDSITVIGRVIRECQSRRSEDVYPLARATIVFLDFKYKDRLIDDDYFLYLDSTVNVPRSNYVSSDKNGCFKIKLAKKNYVSSCMLIGFERTVTEVLPFSQTVDLGDIVLEESVIREFDPNVEGSGYVKVKGRFFHRLAWVYKWVYYVF